MTRKWRDFRAPKRHDLMIGAPPCEQLNKKSKAKHITAELKLQQFKLHGPFCTGKNPTAVFSSLQSSNSSGSVIVVDIYTAVVKILGKASLIAMWNRGCTGWNSIFDKNCFPGLLMWKFLWDWSALLLDVVFFPLHWSGTTRRRIFNEITENEWHLLLLFHRRPLVVGFNRLIGLVSRHGLDVPRLTVMVGKHCDRCSSETLVVRCGSIPARFDISFILLWSVVVPRGALRNQILSSAGLNFLLWPSLGLWNRASDVGLRWSK